VDQRRALQSGLPGLLVVSILLFVGSSVSVAGIFDTGIPAGWTCVGNCGVSAANGVVTLSPAGGAQYGWVSTDSGVMGVALPGVGGTGTPIDGSTLRSVVFNATAGQTLSFYFNFVTSDGAGYSDYAWAQLLNSSLTPVALLFTARTAASGSIIPGFSMPAPAATLTPASVPIIAGAPAWTPLGGDSGLCYSGGCGYTGWVKSSYVVPTTGSYVLQFGVVNWNDAAYDTGLAFDGITIGGDPIGAQNVMVNKDIRNATGQTANDIEILVEGSYASVRSHYDGGFPTFTITPVGPNTQFRWSGLSVPDNVIKHVGIDLDGASMTILGVFWTFDGSAVGCAPQCNIGVGTHTGGTREVIYKNTVTQCSSQALYAGGLTVEYYVAAPALSELNAGGVRSPIASYSIAASPALIDPGGQVAVQIPNPPISAKYAVLVYKVGTEASLTGPSTTDDYMLVAIPPVAAAVPALSEWSVMLLTLTLCTWGLFVIRRRHKSPAAN